MLTDVLREKNLSIYRLSKESGIPYTTVRDICCGKTNLKKCSGETVFNLSKALGISMEDLLQPYMVKRESFDLFKSAVCHELKEKTDIDFMIKLLEEDTIQVYYRRKWYAESLYLLAMLDYLSRINDIPLCNRYEKLRSSKLSHIVYPSSVLALAAVSEDEDQIKQQAIKASIPEFIRFNIVECEVRNVI